MKVQAPVITLSDSVNTSWPPLPGPPSVHAASVSVSETVVPLVEVAEVTATKSISWPCELTPCPPLRPVSQASADAASTKWKPSAIVWVRLCAWW